MPKKNLVYSFGLISSLLLTLLLAACAGPTPSIPPTPQPTPTPTQPAAAPWRPSAALRFQTISLEDGLSQSVVNAILQDRRGFLWFGTQDGLNRYDGVNFKVYKADPQYPASLSDGWIESLIEDNDGNLWIGTYQGGLNKYDPLTDTFTRYRNDPQDSASLGRGVVLALLQDRSGVLWVGSEEGLNKFDPATGAFTHYRNDPNDSNSLSYNAILSIFQDSKGQLWIGTSNGGLELFDPATGKFQHYRARAEVETSLSSNTINAILEDARGQLWIATKKGLNRFDPLTRTFQRYLAKEDDNTALSHNDIHDILLDKTGTLWAATEFGLNRFDETTGTFTRYFASSLVPNSLGNNILQSLYEDREGGLWVGTWGAGLSWHSPAQDKFTLYRANPENPKEFPVEGPFGMYADPSGVVWIGMVGSGLLRFDPATGESQSFQHDPKDPDSLNSYNVWKIYRDRAGALWLGTSNGLEQLDEKTGKFNHHVPDKENPETSLRGSSVSALLESPDGSFWVGTNKGLDKFDRATGLFTHISDPANPTAENTQAIYEDRDGNLWVGTFGAGVYRYDRKNNTFRYYLADPENPKSLSHNLVLSIYQDTRGTIWLATGGGGLNKYDPATDSFSTLTERQGLPNNFIYCIIPDEQDTLWLTTNYGLSHFYPLNETFQNYTVSDGLQSNEFNSNACARNPDGEIYIGGIAGVNRFTPAQIRTNSVVPPVMLTALTQNDRPILTASSVENIQEMLLKWPQNSFDFEFASLSFSDPRKNQYAYMLDGFDTGWNEIGNKHEGRYTNLPGGEYTLRLKASNNDGIWNATGATVKITVVPPFWQTGWFYVLAVLAGGASIWGGYRLRIHGIESNRRELERQVVERTREIERLFEQTKELAIIEERNRLARELHDSAKQKAFAALAQIGTAGGIIQNNPKAAREHLNEAENLVYDVIQELTFLIQEMYPLALKEKGLATSMREYLFEWENRTDIHVGVRIEGERRLPLNLEQTLYRIAQESLANVARHSRATKVDVALEYGTDSARLTVSDNGRGFDPQQKPNGIGLRSIQERAENAGGRVTITSAIGQGTSVCATIPIT